MTIRLNDEIMEHLHCFGIDKLEVVLHHHRLHEVLMNQLATRLPLFAIWHEEDVVASTDDPIPNM